MNFKELGIHYIKPVALLKGGLNGARFIAEYMSESGRVGLLSLAPPDYDVTKSVQIERYLLLSAVEKHGYIPVEHDFILNFEDYEKYLREINNPFVNDNI